MGQLAASIAHEPMFDEIIAAFPGKALLDRTSINTWEDATVIKEVNRIGQASA
jgi:hypothetical protein